MEILLLGPVRLRVDDRLIELGSDKERVALAALAVDAGRPVPVDTLVMRLWDGSPPDHPREGVYVYVSRLRKRLAAAGPDAPTIDGRGHTYLLRCPEGCVDWRRFRRMVAARPADDDLRAVRALVEAESLWAGEPLAGLPGAWADSTRRAMLEERLRAAVLRITALLRLGHFADTVGELTTLADQRPADETVHSLLMIAYHGSQRSAEALQVHQRVRRVLAADYGTSPGRDLDRIHRGVLDGIPAADLIGPGPARGATRVGGRAAGAGPGTAPGGASGLGPGSGGAHRTRPTAAPVAPRNLPHQPPLIGRGGELRLLTEPGDVSAVSLEAVTGMAGVGKTALAVHAADRLAVRYPDAQLYLNFRTHAAGQAPVTQAEALVTLLRLLDPEGKEFPAGPDGQARIPSGLDEQAALWQRMLADRRVVLVLDDIAHAAQVTSLLPQAGSSLAITTSRRHVAGIPHARRVRIDVLATPDAVALFRRFAGHERTGDLRQVRRVVQLCGHLPLAIELVASRFHTRTWTLTDLVERLSRPSRLAEIHDTENSLVRAFELTDHTLTPQQRRAFRLLSLHPGADFTADAAGALLDLPPAATEHLLEELLACHLISEPVPERFQYHDLLREFARVLAESDGIDGRRDLRRMTEFYGRVAHAADRAAYPRRLRPDDPDGDRTPPPHVRAFTDASHAKAWLNAERQNLLAVFDHAMSGQDTGPAADLGYSLAGFLQTEGRLREAESVLHRTAAVWHASGHTGRHALAVLGLAAVQADTGQYARSAQHTAAVLAYARTARRPGLEAEALLVEGRRKWHQGEHRAALAAYEEALTLKTASGDIWQRARVLNNIAVVNLFLGRHDEAMELFESALRSFAETNDKLSSARILNNLGDMRLRKGELESARRSFEESLAFLNDAGTLYDQATVRAGLADTLLASGQVRESLALYEQCLAELRSLDDHKGAAETLIGMARAHRLLGNAGESAGCLSEALDLATRIGAAELAAQAREAGARDGREADGETG